MVSREALAPVSVTRYRPGPAMLVTAAFIGPGTVTACASAGIGFGYALLWALVFATLATIILQNMAARVAYAGAYIRRTRALDFRFIASKIEEEQENAAKKRKAKAAKATGNKKVKKDVDDGGDDDSEDDDDDDDDEEDED